MATTENKKNASEEQPVVDRSYMRTWGSTRQNKLEFEEAHQNDQTKAEAAGPGVNPVVAPDPK